MNPHITAMHQKCMAVFYIKVLSIMTITRERLTNHSGRETGGRGDPCAGE